MEENSLRYIIPTSLLSGLSVGCIGSAIGTGSLTLSITAGICSTLCVFSYMFSQRKQKSDYIALIEQEMEKNAEIVSSVNNLKTEYISGAETIIEKISDNTEELNNIQSVLYQFIDNKFTSFSDDVLAKKDEELKKIAENQKRIDSIISSLSRLLNSISEFDAHNTEVLQNLCSECNKYINSAAKKMTDQIERVNQVQSELNSMLKTINDETLTEIKGKQNNIKNLLDTIDSNINNTLCPAVQSNANDICGEIQMLGTGFSNITTGMSENNDKMKTLSDEIRKFNDSYQELLNKMTSEQKRMLDLQHANCDLLKNIGDRFRGDLKR